MLFNQTGSAINLEPVSEQVTYTCVEVPTAIFIGEISTHIFPFDPTRSRDGKECVRFPLNVDSACPIWCRAVTDECKTWAAYQVSVPSYGTILAGFASLIRPKLLKHFAFPFCGSK
jgi:hypothetical protein